MSCCSSPFRWQPWMGLPAHIPTSQEPTCNPVAAFTGLDPSPMTVLQGGALPLVNTSTGAASYQWFVDGVPVSTAETPALTADGACQSLHTVMLTAYCDPGQAGASTSFSAQYEVGCA